MTNELSYNEKNNKKNKYLDVLNCCDIDTIDDTDLNFVFNLACKNVKYLNNTPDNDQLLMLYGLYKQSTIGNCNENKPTSFFDLKASKKWDAWNNLKDLNQNKAKISYINFVKTLIINDLKVCN